MGALKKYAPEIIGFLLAAAGSCYGFLSGALGTTALGVTLLIAAAVFLWLARRTGSRIADARREILVRERDAKRVSRRFAERALAIEKIPDPLLLLDDTHRIVFANDKAAKLFGGETEDKDFRTIVRDAPVADAVKQTLGDGRARTLEIALNKPATRFFETSIAVIELEEDKPLVAVNFHEITELKRAHQMRTDFVANAGHELKTPLTSLLGFIETLEGPAKGDKKAAEKFLPIMHGEAERMVRLIDDLLSLSRIEAQQHLTPKDKVKLAGVLKSVASSLEHAAAKRQIAITVHVPNRLAPVVGDKDQLFQLFQNLVSNAIKYGRTNSEVTITAKKVERVPGSGHPGVAISVADQGEGIPAEHIPRLTERFYRVDAARSKKAGGTGLGLAIVKHIVGRHQGRLEIRSAVGKGTTVTVTLPRAE